MATTPPKNSIIPRVTGAFSSTTVNPGKTVTFTWSSTRTSTARLYLTGSGIDFVPSYALAGSRVLTVPMGAKVGTKIRVNWLATSPTGGIITGSATVTVVAASISPEEIIYPVVSLNTAPTAAAADIIKPGQSTIISWDSSDTTKLSLSAPNFKVAGSDVASSTLRGQVTATAPMTPAQYNIKIKATSPTGLVKDFTFPVTVTAPPLPKPTPVVPVITGVFAPSTVTVGSPSTLTWSSTHITSMILTSTDITLRATTVSGTKAITVPTTYKNNTVTINYIATASDSKQHKGSFVLLVTAATVAPPIGPPKVTFTITPEYNPTLKPIAVGSRFTIAWTASDTTTLKLTGLGLNTTAVNGSQTVTAPPKPGTYYITVVAVGPTGKKNSTTEMFTVGKATVVVPPVVEPVIQLQFNPSSFTLGSASANTSTLTWQVTNADSIMLTSSPLLAINSTSTSGSRTITAPTVPGAYNVTITVPRTTGTAKTAQATFTVLDPVTLKLISTQGYQVPDCAVGSPYQYEYTASGGVPPYKFTIDEKFGILPYGLTMNSAGAITGTPIATQKTTASFTVVLTDSMNKTDRLDGSIQITATGVPKLQFVGWPSNMQLPDSKVSGDYRWRLTAEGGIAPYSFSIDANYPLPAGLTLSTTGLITGISTVATDPARPLGLNLVIYVTDAAGTRAGGDFFIRVRTN